MGSAGLGPGPPAPTVRAAPRRRSGLCSALLQAGQPGRQVAVISRHVSGARSRSVGAPGSLGHSSRARERHLRDSALS